MYDVGEADDHLVFVMELVEGTTLRDYVRERPLDPSEVIAIGVQIADALAVAHSKGIVHRDIKPATS